MKLYLSLFSGLMFCSTVLASQDLIVCPVSLTCNYEAGTCDMPAGQWGIDSSRTTEPFSDAEPLNISKISAGKEGSGYHMVCTYKYGKHSALSIYTFAAALIGENWVYSGFGQQDADCSQPSAVSSCAGQN